MHLPDFAGRMVCCMDPVRSGAEARIAAGEPQNVIENQENTMDDMNAMNREMKKQQLRRQIVPNPGEERPKPPSPYPEEDEEEAIKKAHHKVLRHRLVISLVIVLVIAAIAGGVQYWKQNHQYLAAKVQTLAQSFSRFLNCRLAISFCCSTGN